MTKQKPPDGIAELTCTNISVRVHVTYLPEYVAKRDDVANPVFLSVSLSNGEVHGYNGPHVWCGSGCWYRCFSPAEQNRLRKIARTAARHYRTWIAQAIAPAILRFPR